MIFHIIAGSFSTDSRCFIQLLVGFSTLCLDRILANWLREAFRCGRERIVSLVAIVLWNEDILDLELGSS